MPKKRKPPSSPHPCEQRDECGENAVIGIAASGRQQDSPGGTPRESCPSATRAESLRPHTSRTPGRYATSLEDIAQQIVLRPQAADRLHHAGRVGQRQRRQKVSPCKDEPESHHHCPSAEA